MLKIQTKELLTFLSEGKLRKQRKEDTRNKGQKGKQKRTIRVKKTKRWQQVTFLSTGELGIRLQKYRKQQTTKSEKEISRRVQSNKKEIKS